MSTSVLELNPRIHASTALGMVSRFTRLLHGCERVAIDTWMTCCIAIHGKSCHDRLVALLAAWSDTKPPTIPFVLDFFTLSRLSYKLIHTSIRPYGPYGPYGSRFRTGIPNHTDDLTPTYHAVTLIRRTNSPPTESSPLFLSFPVFPPSSSGHFVYLASSGIIWYPVRYQVL